MTDDGHTLEQIQLWDQVMTQQDPNDVEHMDNKNARHAIRRNVKDCQP